MVAEAVKKEDGSTVLHKYMMENKGSRYWRLHLTELMTKADVECRVTSLGPYKEALRLQLVIEY